MTELPECRSCQAQPCDEAEDEPISTSISGLWDRPGSTCKAFPHFMVPITCWDPICVIHTCSTAPADLLSTQHIYLCLGFLGLVRLSSLEAQQASKQIKSAAAAKPPLACLGLFLFFKGLLAKESSGSGASLQS